MGAEIKDSQEWQEKFIGKKVFVDGTQDVAISIVKKVEDPTTQVDCVTGATLTSNGVNDMIKAGLKDAGKNALELFTKMMCTPDSEKDCCKENCKDTCKENCKDDCKDICKENCKDGCKDCCKQKVKED